MRAETITFEGPAAVWDAADQEPFRALAGTRFLGVDDGTAIVLTAGGREQPIYPGWVVILPEGGQPVFSSPDRARITDGD